jgi:hypothetical protein
MNEKEKIEFAEEVLKYCEKYYIPLNFFIEILEDQKVIPMIRGKGMEYNAFLVLQEVLSSAAWSIQKLNLNAQQGFTDEDISITHRRTGIMLKVESKSAVRGNIRDGEKSKIIKEPHFKVKCHRSRSNISLANSSNDRYSEDEFDLIMTNPVNALFVGNTIGDTFELIDLGKIKKTLLNLYSSSNEEELINKVSADWRFVIPKDISVNGFIPRTPFIKLSNDENWRPIVELEKRLLEIVGMKRDHSIRRI